MLLSHFLIFPIWNVISTVDFRREGAESHVHNNQKRADETVTITADAAPSYTPSPAPDAPKPTGSDVTVVEGASGLDIYMGEEFRSALNKTLQDKCGDLYSADCHSALLAHFQDDEVDQWQDISKKRNPVLALLGGIRGAYLAGSLIVGLVNVIVSEFANLPDPMKSGTPPPLPYNFTALHIPSDNVKEAQNSNDASAVAFVASPKDPNPILDQALVIEQNDPTQGKQNQTAQGLAPIVEPESNGDYTIHMDKGLSDAIGGVLATNKTSCLSKSDGKRGHYKRGGGPADIAAMESCITAGMVSVFKSMASGPTNALRQITEKGNQRIAARPGMKDALDIITNAVQQANEILLTLKLSDEIMRVLSNVVYFAVNLYLTTGTHDLTAIRVKVADQDKTKDSECPPQKLLRCEHKACLPPTGEKTMNEICPEGAWFEGCPCTDCADDEFMPFCDNCGGSQEKPNKDQDSSGKDGGEYDGEDDGKQRRNQRRKAPDPMAPKNATCNGFPDQGWKGCSCIITDGPPPLIYFKNQTEFEEVQQALLNLPKLKPNETQCPEPPPPSNWGAWLGDAVNSCFSCFGGWGGCGGAPGKRSADSPNVCSCAADTKCPNAKCYAMPGDTPDNGTVSEPPEPISSPTPSPSPSAACLASWPPPNMEAWVDSEKNSCGNCPSKQADQCSTDPMYSNIRVCTCTGSDCKAPNNRCWLTPMGGSPDLKAPPSGVAPAFDPAGVCPDPVKFGIGVNEWFGDEKNHCKSCPKQTAKDADPKYNYKGCKKAQRWKEKHLCVCADSKCNNGNCWMNKDE